MNKSIKYNEISIRFLSRSLVLITFDMSTRPMTRKGRHLRCIITTSFSTEPRSSCSTSGGPPKYSDVNQSAADFCWLNILKFPRIVVFFDIYVDVVGYFIYSHCLPWSTQQTHLVQFTAEAPPSSADRPNLNAEINMGSCIVSDIFRKPQSNLSESPPRHPLSPSCPTLSVYLYCMLLVMNLARSPFWFICSQSASSRRPKQEPTIIIWINWNFLSCR